MSSGSLCGWYCIDRDHDCIRLRLRGGPCARQWTRAPWCSPEFRETRFSTADNNRVDSIAWITGAGASTGNLASNGGPLHCNNPLEFFGQSYGDGGNSHPFLVVSSVTSRWKSPAGNTLTGKTKVNTGVVCDFRPRRAEPAPPTRSKNRTAVENQMTVQRSFSFKTVSNTSDLRAYVPRLPIGAYGAVSWPNAASVVQTGNAGSCSGGCIVTDWNGTWFAEQTSAGQGLVVIRNPKSGPPALLVFDNNSFSNSNNSAVALRLPAGGWLGTYRETENISVLRRNHLAGVPPGQGPAANRLHHALTTSKLAARGHLFGLHHRARLVQPVAVARPGPLRSAWHSGRRRPSAAPRSPRARPAGSWRRSR